MSVRVAQDDIGEKDYPFLCPEEPNGLPCKVFGKIQTYSSPIKLNKKIKPDVVKSRRNDRNRFHRGWLNMFGAFGVSLETEIVKTQSTPNGYLGRPLDVPLMTASSRL